MNKLVRQSTFTTGFHRTIRALPLFARRKIRLSVIYLAGAAVVLAAWLVSMVGGPTGSTQSSASPGTTTTETLLEPQTEGGTTPMNTETPGSSNSSTSQTTVNADDSGTSVTVNGQTQTAPPNQSLQQSYSTDDGTTQTHVDVSVDNNDVSQNGQSTTSGGRNLNVHLHSSTKSRTTNP